MTAALKTIFDVTRTNLGRLLLTALVFTVLYYAALLGSMILRFGNLPNYTTGYDWFGNVYRIIQSTPAVSDMLPIISEEWLLEVGYMNMSFGHGISEWSLNLIPLKMLMTFSLGILIGLSWFLARKRQQFCSRPQTVATAAASGFGATLVALTGATMSWVVCCATPSWIVGLAMLGMGVATANALEPYGIWVGGFGYAVLGAMLFVQAQSLANANTISQGDDGPVDALALGNTSSALRMPGGRV